MLKVFKGQPQDLQSTRITELYIAFDEDERRNVTIQMQGEHPNFRAHEVWNQPLPWMRPNYYRRLAVSTFMTTGRELNMRVRDAIWGTPVSNAELDYSCQSWVGDAGECFSPRRPCHRFEVSFHVSSSRFLALVKAMGHRIPRSWAEKPPLFPRIPGFL